MNGWLRQFGTTAGLAGIYALSDLEPDRLQSISRAGELLAVATQRMTRDVLSAAGEAAELIGIQPFSSSPTWALTESARP